MKNTPSPDNLLLGAGALYIDRFENGQKTGELHFGNVTAFGLNTSDETKQLFESMTHARGLYKEVTLRRNVTINITGNEYNAENVALSLMGDQGKLVQTQGTVVDQTLTASAKPGRFYPVGKRNISAVTVKEDTTEYVAGVDYEVDAVSGRIKVLGSGSIADGSPLTVSYTHSAVNLDTIEGGKAGTVEASLRFIGDPNAGPAVEVEVFRVKVNPSGELGFITEDFGAWSLTCSVLSDSSRPAGESPFYRVIYL